MSVRSYFSTWDPSAHAVVVKGSARVRYAPPILAAPTFRLLGRVRTRRVRTLSDIGAKLRAPPVCPKVKEEVGGRSASLWVLYK